MTLVATLVGVVVTVTGFGVPSAAGIRFSNKMVAGAFAMTSVPVAEPVETGSLTTAETA